MNNNNDVLSMYRSAITEFETVLAEKKATLQMLKIKYEYDESDEVREVMYQIADLELQKVQAEGNLDQEVEERR